MLPHALATLCRGQKRQGRLEHRGGFPGPGLLGFQNFHFRHTATIMADEKDNSGSQNKVRFAVDDDNVDKDLSIHPSAHNENNLEGAPSARTADKYYKDMQSIHGDMVRCSFPSRVYNGQVTPCGGARCIATTSNTTRSGRFLIQSSSVEHPHDPRRPLQQSHVLCRPLRGGPSPSCSSSPALVTFDDANAS